MKYCLVTIAILLFWGCSPILKVVLNVHEPQVYNTRNVTADRIKADLNQYGINFTIIFRGDQYLTETMDSSIYDQDIAIYNRDGNSCYLNAHQYNLCKDVSYRVITKYKAPLSSLAIDTTHHISEVLKVLEDENGNRILLEQLEKHNYYLVMDWTTFMIGMQKRLLKKIKESIGDEDVFFIIKDKDIVRRDAIYQQLYAKHLKKRNYREFGRSEQSEK